jgi:acetyltransferase-like isoleucine patch superfamily enzyme
VTPVASIVIPAHEEEGVIGRSLQSVLADAEPGELEIIVVANGCTDATADVASSFPGVHVVTTPVSSKAHALNLGDSLAAHWPRLYIDADVVVTTAAVRAVANQLRPGGALAAAPRMQVDLAGRPWTVRAYYRIYQQVPYARKAMVGSGFYGLSEEGHRRIGAFPDLMNDDMVVHQAFAIDERTCIDDHVFTISAPHDLGTLVRTKARVATGILQYRDAVRRGLHSPAASPADTASPASAVGPADAGSTGMTGPTGPAGSVGAASPSGAGPTSAPSARDAYRSIAREPRNWLALAIYTAVYGTTRLAARRRFRKGDLRWTSDRTIRMEITPRMNRHLTRMVRSVLDPRAYLHALKLMNFANYSHVVERSKIRTGHGVKISPTASFRNGSRITIGSGTHVGERCMLWAGDSRGAIGIGEHCLLGPEVMLTASNYDPQPGTLIMDSPKREDDIHIGRNVWLGARVTVTAGVSIGDDCVVGAGAVVTRSLPPGTIAGGVPARALRSVDLTADTSHSDAVAAGSSADQIEGTNR